MSDNIDFKNIWNQQQIADAPQVEEVIKKAVKLKRKTRNKLLFVNLVLLVTLAFAFKIKAEMVTTRIGIVVGVIAILTYVAASNFSLIHLFKGNVQANTSEYLRQLIRLKQKQEFLQKTMLTIYFILLSAGLMLYMIEYALLMSWTGRILSYGLTIGWIAFNWFYLRPRTIKKQQQELNELIIKLETINNQINPDSVQENK